MRIREDIRRAAQLLRPEKANYGIGLAALLLVNLSDVLAPLFLAVAIELIEARVTGAAAQTPPALALVGLDAGTFTLVGAVGAFLGLGLVANLSRYPMTMYTAVPSHRIGQRVRRAIAGALLGQSQAFYDRAKSGDLMSRATADVNALRMMFGPGVVIFADTLMLVSMVIALLLVLSWPLTLIAVLPLPVIYWITNRLSHAEYEAYEDVQGDLSRMTERVRESYAGLRILQGYAREDFDRARFEAASRRHLHKNLRLARVRALFDPTLDLMLGVSTALVLIFGGLRVVEGTMTLGTFVAFLFLVSYLAGPMIGFGWSISLFQRGRASLRRVDELLEAPVDITTGPQAVLAGGEGAISVRGLTFRYPLAERRGDEDESQALLVPVEADSPAVLHDVSFEVAAGATVGIFGPVGSGKSTLVSLLARLYDPPPGSVFLDGVDVRELELASLRRSVVLAPQETFLFSTSVERNIQLASDVQALSEQAEQAEQAAAVRRHAELAHLHGEVEGFTQGYQTMLGERGVNLSGGQRQRLAIARAIAADPMVLVLDDCLSAVDARTEEAILGNLREVFAGRTGIIVSHRVRAVRGCDRIIVLEQGRVVEQGTHEALMRGDGYYAAIAREQQEAGEPAVERDGEVLS